MDSDLEAFRIEEGPLPESERPRTSEPGLTTQPRNRLTCRFVKGPIKLPWLLKAAALSGKSPLLLALALHFQAGLMSSKSDIRLTSKLKNEFALPDRTARLAVKKLEAAGLIAVERKAGQCLRVTILDNG
jgi:hypothetical protein